MQQVRRYPQRRAPQKARQEAAVIDYKELRSSFQQHWRVITPVWAILPAVFLASRLLGGVLDYSIVFWAFSLLFFGGFFWLSYRTYELVAAERLPLSHWLVLVWVPWMPLAILSKTLTSSF